MGVVEPLVDKPARLVLRPVDRVEEEDEHPLDWRVKRDALLKRNYRAHAPLPRFPGRAAVWSEGRKPAHRPVS